MIFPMLLQVAQFNALEKLDQSLRKTGYEVSAPNENGVISIIVRDAQNNPYRVFARLNGFAPGVWTSVYAEKPLGKKPLSRDVVNQLFGQDRKYGHFKLVESQTKDFSLQFEIQFDLQANDDPKVMKDTLIFVRNVGEEMDEAIRRLV